MSKERREEGDVPHGGRYITEQCIGRSSGKHSKRGE